MSFYVRVEIFRCGHEYFYLVGDAVRGQMLCDAVMLSHVTMGESV